MAITSIGYDGSVNEAEWAKMIPAVGSSSYGVKDTADWKVTPHATMDRGVNIAVGSGWGHGVLDTSDTTVSLQGATVGSGSRWDCVVMRRNWSGTGGLSEFVLISGSSTKQIPSRNTSPGSLDDQPIALVRFDAGQTAPQEIIDLRCWSHNTGMAARDDLVRNYLNKPGTAVTINRATWRYVVGANDIPEWISDGPSVYSPIQVNGYSITGTFTVEIVGALRRVAVDITVKRTGGNTTIGDDWAPFGTVVPPEARGSSGGGKYLPVSLSGGGNNVHATVYLMSHDGTMGIRAITSGFTWTTNALFTLNLTYYI